MLRINFCSWARRSILHGVLILAVAHDDVELFWGNMTVGCSVVEFASLAV